MKVDNQTVQALAASLKFREMRQKIISSNVANAQTPGYKAKRLDFEQALARAIDLDKSRSMNSSDERHFDVGGGGFTNLKPEIYQDPNGVVSKDGNTVDRESEMAKMAENEILFNATAKLLRKQLALKNYAISSDR